MRGAVPQASAARLSVSLVSSNDADTQSDADILGMGAAGARALLEERRLARPPEISASSCECDDKEVSSEGGGSGGG